MNDNEKPMRTEANRTDEPDERLMEEINILKLEGLIFCFDPREARRRRGAITLADALKQPVTIKIDADYGQPSVLAYKVAQATFLKLASTGCSLTEDGRCTFNPDVVFSWRELATITGRSWGGKTSEELYHAVMQLRYTFVRASLFNKENGEWSLGSDFSMFDRTYFSGKDRAITRAAFRVAPEIIKSLNQWHVAFFNLSRMRQLDTLGLVLAKRIFFHLSNLVSKDDVERFKRTGRWPANLRLRKDYEAICNEWLGGLKPLKYRSQIERDQLGPHFQSIDRTTLTRKCAIERNASGSGFNVEFYPGRGFFEDYEALYLKRAKPVTFTVTTDLEEVKALELIGYFHRQIGHDDRTHFEDHEVAYALELMRQWSAEEIRDLVDYALDRAKRTGFEMLYFNALKRYTPTWSSSKRRRGERVQKAEETIACPFCDGSGLLRLIRLEDDSLVGHPCPHNPEQIAKLEAQLKVRRISL